MASHQVRAVRGAYEHTITTIPSSCVDDPQLDAALRDR